MTSDPLEARIAREMIRGIDVELIGMEAQPRYRWKDPGADDGDAGDVAAAQFRKFRLFSKITPPNLGKTGEPDLANSAPSPPGNVTLCGGQCDSVRVTWEVPVDGFKYSIQLYDNDSNESPLPLR